MKAFLMAFIRPVTVVKWSEAPMTNEPVQIKRPGLKVARVIVTSSEHLSQMQTGRWVKLAEAGGPDRAGLATPSYSDACKELGRTIRADGLGLAWIAPFLDESTRRDLELP